MNGDRVAAVVVTYERVDVVRDTLDHVLGQVRPPDLVYLVDNGSRDGTPEVVAEHYPEVEVLVLPDDPGFGAGMAAGIRAGRDAGADWFWPMDDDSQPAPETLGELLRVVDGLDPGSLGALAMQGGTVRGGIVRHRATRDLPRLPGPEPLHEADVVLIDGALIPRSAVEVAGYPRDDLFLVWEDLEYAMRLRESGRRLVVLDRDLMTRQHLGSGIDGQSSPPWRGYYQTRNHLAVALNRGSPVLVLGWGLRTAKILLATVFRLDRKRERLRLRLLGAWHGATGRTGRTVDPGS